MFRPVRFQTISIALFLTSLFCAGALASTHPSAKSDKTGTARHKSAATAAHETKPAQPPAPKTPAELQQDLATFFKAGRFSGDSVQVQVEQQKIILTGTVHGAENKGVATTQTRLIARKDGWDNVHVLNRLTVNLPVSW